MQKAELSGVNIAIKCLQSFEAKVDAEMDGKTALRIARESLQETVRLCGGPQ